ncbi:GATA transcription factor 9 [Linum grandiflorum]
MESSAFFMAAYYYNTSVQSNNYLPPETNPTDVHANFAVDDLLDFPNDDDAIMTDGFFDNLAKNCATVDSPAFTPNDSSNSSSTTSAGYQSIADSHFCSELCVPYDDMAELEWLSNFVDDTSYSTDQTLQTNLHMLSGSKPESSSSDTHFEPMGRNNANNNSMFQADTPLPGKARSKRSRIAPGNWTTRLLHLTPSIKGASKKKQQGPNPYQNGSGSGSTVRRCLHCGSDKTPQWRTGPMGPKTLCNACGVRYKSGRLVAEYRPAASPTFVPAKHSNSHRKVLELRRHKEMHMVQQEQFLTQKSMFGDHQYLINHHHTAGGHNFRPVI